MVGLSKAVKIRTGSRRHGHPASSATFKINDSAKRRSKDRRLRQDVYGALSFEDRQMLDDLHRPSRNAAGDGLALGAGSDDEGFSSMLPPGEEAMFLSNAGSENDFCHALFETERGKSGKIPTLIDAYLSWKLNSWVDSTREEDAEGSREFSMQVIEIYATISRSFCFSDNNETVNTCLARNGYLGTAPLLPTLAIDFRVLEAYRQQHRACPRFSIQAQVKALCYMHGVPFRDYLADQFSIAYDAYLSIQRGIEARMSAALRRDTPDWRMLNACAPCLYHLKDEPPLKYSMLGCMDGNMSLRLVDDVFRNGTARQDERSGMSDYFLTPEYVDRFKDEVKNAKAKMSGTQGTQGSDSQDKDNVAEDDLAWLEVGDEDEELSKSTAICVERWRNAGPEARKKMFALFAVTGIFLCLCRHGQVLIMCDMIRSGELMKYPLAIIDKLIEVYGPDMEFGYDIACALWKTLMRSSLGDKVKIKRFSVIVPAFHGHGHNRGCQVLWHPLYRDGAGKEDFEGCERCFSESNALASGTRLASPFHRHQAIDEHFHFWDEQKHAESGNFIYNNYRQALNIIQEDSLVLAALSEQLHTTSEDYDRYLEQEREYLRGLQDEAPHIARMCEYMEALQRLAATREEYNLAKQAFDQNRFIDVSSTSQASQARRSRSWYTTSGKRLEIAETTVCRIEEEQEIEQRWQPGMPEYEEAAKELRLRKYRAALDNLERLLVQRLFELMKLGMSGTGYKLREKIGKALKARAEAIKNALNEYNTQAAGLNPPRPLLSWVEAVEMVSLAEFDLLRDARQDIRSQPWAKPANRRAMNLHFNIKRAHEEIAWLNIEIPRSLTSIYDEHADYYRAIQRTCITNPGLASELSQRWEYRTRINEIIVQRLVRTSGLPRFSGHLITGQRIGRDPSTSRDIPPPSWAIPLQATNPPAAGECDANRVSIDSETVPIDHGTDSDTHDALIPGVADNEEADRLLDFLDGLGDQAHV